MFTTILVAEKVVMKTQFLQIARSMLLALTAFILSGEVVAQTQDTTTLVRIETRDGNEYVGKIVEVTLDHIRLETQSLGMITISKNDIVNVEAVSVTQIKDNVYWFDNPQATRYLWGPNGYGLKKGEGYYQNIWVLFNHFSVGVTDNFSLGGGVIPLFMFAGAATPVWITPKFSIPVTENKLNVGVGGLFGTVAGLEETGFGLAFGHLTLGPRDRNVTFGMGYGYAGGDWANRPTLSIASSIRTGPRGYFMTENYYISTGDTGGGLLSFAGRRLYKKTALDYGLILPLGTGGVLIAVPWLGLTIPFGKNIRTYE